MSAILWKEFRENLKWAVLILLIFGAAMCFTVLPSSWSPYWEQVPIMGSRYGGLSSFRMTCEHCLASFPAPTLDGTEIFA